MLYPMADIINSVRILMNEDVNLPGVPVFDATSLDLDTLVRKNITDAVRTIHLTAPTHLLEGSMIDATPVKNQDGSGYILLPDNFMRLVIFQMEGWKRPVTRPITDQHPDYILQKNRYVRGGTDKPVCVVSTNRTGKNILEYYSLPGSVAIHTLKQALYMPYPIIESEKINISQRLLSAALFQCVALIYTAFKETNISNYYFERAHNILVEWLA